LSLITSSTRFMTSRTSGMTRSAATAKVMQMAARVRRPWKARCNRLNSGHVDTQSGMASRMALTNGYRTRMQPAARISSRASPTAFST
jgi:hypothetical protein